MCEGGIGADVEYGKGVLAVIHATGREDDGDEVYAGVFQERCRGRFREELEDGEQIALNACVDSNTVVDRP